MKSYTLQDVAHGLHEAGIVEGDVVLVHSGIFQFGRLEDVPSDKVCEELYGVFRDVIGSTGTLLVPAYFSDYARKGIPYDARKSPVSRELGVFSQYVVSLPDSVRSLNPLTGLAAAGPKAEAICRAGSATGYGAGSPWDELTKVNAKMAFFGTTIARAMTYIHYIEQRYGVPHMYFKLHTTPVYDDGVPVDNPVVTYVRYLNYNIWASLERFEKKLGELGLIGASKIGMGHLHVVNTQDALQVGLEELKKDVYYFLKHPPEFVAGEIPTDGAVGEITTKARVM